MALKTREQIAAMCRELRERSGMSQTEWGASLTPAKSRQMVTYAETNFSSQHDGIRQLILEQKGDYIVTELIDVKRRTS